jgi:filamentous hemagglutinin
MKTCGGAQYLLFGVTLLTNPIAAIAQIVADPRAGAQGPIVGQTQNGIPQVDITAPSGAGVSRNAYVQFDVPQSGAILNNSSAIVQTLQAGLITGNPNLGPGESAKIIVNEVAGDMPSQLRGYLEVAGNPAEVVVANSNGIVADAAGFINTTRGILTTGAPMFSPDGGLDGFDVRRGELAVQGAGLNTSNLDQLDLIARGVSADAMIHAKTLNVVAGANQVDHETLAATPDRGVPPASEVRIDVTGLGGIYANRIALVATEAGIGVANRGVLAAQEGDLRLTAEGRLILTGKTYANGDLALASGEGIDNGGTTSGARGVSVDTRGDVYNSGVLGAQGDLKVAARNLVSTGTLAQAGAAPMTIAIEGLLDNSNGTLQTSGSDIHLSSGTLVNDYGRISQAGDGALHISSDRVSNRGGAIASGGELRIRATDLSNQAGTLNAQRQVDVDARSFDNSQGGYVEAGNVTLVAQHMFDNRGGSVEAGHDLAVSAHDVLNRTGSLGAKQHAQFDVGSFDNSQRGYVGADNIALTAREIVDNRGGALEASEGLAIAALAITNDAGSIRNSEEGVLSIAAMGGVSNTQGGRIGSNGALKIASSAFDNTGGSLVSEATGAGDITLATGRLANDNGIIDSGRDVDVSATSMEGGGLVVAAHDAIFRIASDYTHNTGNTLHANHDLTLTTLGNFANRGQLGAVNALTLNAVNVDNPSGASLNAVSTTVNATGTINNAGRLEGETVTTHSAALSNVATVIGRSVTLNAGVIDNTGPSAVIAGAWEVNLYANERFSNTGQAKVFSLGDIHIAADPHREVSRAAVDHVVAAGRLANRTNTVINDRSTLEAQGNLEIAANTLINARPAPVVETVTTGVTTQHQRKRDKYTACATGNAVSNSTCSQAVWDFGYKVPRNATYEASQIVSASKGSDAVDRLLLVRTNGGQQVHESIYYNAMTEHGDGSITVSYWDGYDPNIHYDPASEYPTRSDGHKGYQRVEFSRDTTTTRREDLVTGVEAAAQMVAGGNLTLANVGLVDNHYGTIAAGKSIWIGGGKYDGQVDSMVAEGPHGTTTVNNTGRTLYRHESQDIVSRYAWNKDIRRDAGLVPQAPVILPPVAIGGTGGTIVANEAIRIGARDIRNTNVAAFESPTGMTGSTASAHPGGRDTADGSRRDAGYGDRDGAGLWRSVIAADGMLDLRLPTNGLYDIHVAPEHPYLIVTDPRLTSYTEFISSDYMLEQLGLNPQSAQKRLGDGLVEQQEIRNQITTLTGRAHLPGYAGAQDEYRALMASGVRAARQFDLVPGIALTSAQMDALTSDIVWLVSQPVKLPDGGLAQVLAPVVYLTRMHAGDLRPGGAVISGDDLELHALGDVSNSGEIKGRSRTVVMARDIRNRAGTIGDDGAAGHGGSGERGESSAASRAGRGKRGTRDGKGAATERATGSATVVAAARDVINESGRITGKRIAVLAGRDIVNATLVDAPREVSVAGSGTALVDASPGGSQGGTRGTRHGGRAGATVLGARGTIASSGDLVMTAGRDLMVHGAEITAGSGRDDDLKIAAGRDITMDTVESTTSQSVSRNDRHHWEARRTTHQTSLIAAGGGLAMHSGNDMTFKGARIAAGQDLDIDADGNLAAAAVLNDTRFNNTAADDETRQEVSRGYDQRAMGTAFSAGRNATLVAGSAGRGDLTLTGSSLTAGETRGMRGAVTLAADGNVTLDRARESHEFDMNVSSRRGSFISGTHRTDRVGRAMTRAIGSTVGSLQGNVSIRSGGKVHIRGSDLVAVSAADDLAEATGHIDIRARNISIEPATDTVHDTASQTMSQYGVTVAPGGVVGNALVAVNQSFGKTNRSEDPQLAALDQARAAMLSYRAMQLAASAMENASGTAMSPARSPTVLKAAINVGRASSHRESRQAATINTGSALAAGGVVSLLANGEAGDGDIRISGSRIGAREISLRAAGDITLQSAQDIAQHVSRIRGSRASLGVGAAIGGMQNGFTLELAAGGSGGRSNGSRLTQRETQVSATDRLSMRSGRDINLLGATVSAHAVDVAVGQNLTIASRQDTNTFRSGQTSAGFQASVCVPPFCYGQTADGSAQAGARVLRNDFASVGRQSGIRAGEGGYRIEVGNHTQLDGGVLASMADPSRNSLSSGTFGYTNLQNVARHAGLRLDFRARGQVGQRASGDAKSASPPQKVGTAAGPPASPRFGPGGFSAAGTGLATPGMTYAAVSPGAIKVRADIGIGQDSTAGLSRDPSRANGAVRDRFDARKVSDNLAVQQRSAQVGMQMAGDIGTSFASRAAKAKERAERAYRSAQAVGDAGAMEDARVDTAAADRQLARWGEGGAARVASHAATAALGAAMGGGSVPGAAGGTVAGDIVSHAVSQAVEDLPGGRLLTNAAAGAVGAAAGALSGDLAGAMSGANGALSADLYNRQLHGDEAGKLAALKRGRSDEAQQRLNDAACALVHCSAGVPDNDPNRQALADSESRGSGYTAEQEEIRAAGAFDGYGRLELFGDVVDRYQVSNRTVGAVHGVTGAAGAAAALGAGCSTFAICGFAATVATTSLDYSKAGFRQMILGEPAPTYGEQMLRSLGMSPDEAALTYGAANLATTLGRASLMPRTNAVVQTSKPYERAAKTPPK